jgi:predicted Rossmann fold flavoprotein
MSDQSRVIVIGAGAAGLMAAIHAAERGASVVVLERTKDGGRKILISGGGRCNVLPSRIDPGRFVSESSPALVRKLLLSWPLAAQRAFFEERLGIPLALEDDTGKLFPASNRARDIRDGLVAEARRLGVVFHFEVAVVDLLPAEPGWRVKLPDGGELAARAVVLTTGGLSVPATGSDGTGLAITRRLGHTVRQTYPALTPLTTDPAVHAMLAGITVTATLEAKGDGRRIHTTDGLLFTHRGYSGPAVLDLSHVAVRSRLAGRREPIRACWSAVDDTGWETRLTERSPRGVLTILREALPARLAEQLLAEAGVDGATQLAQLKREDRRRLIDYLVRYSLPWTGDEGYKKAEVTGGGVALEEVHSQTMESRLHPGLHLAGEILDAFGPIGGYNFSWAWSTGRLAGRAVRDGK